jgi:hypothetical protein
MEAYPSWMSWCEGDQMGHLDIRYIEINTYEAIPTCQI